MFVYMYSYHPDTWEGYVKNGLIGKNSGLRVSNSVGLEANMKFNELAKKGGALYNLIKELDGPMYMDRLQGGIAFHEYDYDFDLLEEYKNLLGDNFYGMQFHEWVTNIRSDMRKILKDGDCQWTAEGIEKAVRKNFPQIYTAVEAFSVDEYVNIGKIETAERIYEVAMMLLERRIKDYRLVPCDSHALAYKAELERGVKTFMPEVGAQTPDARFQIGYAKSMAKAYNARFGVYYEPWGGNPFGSCIYERNGKNEWNINGKSVLAFTVESDTGGSSRSMQKRILHYSYLSGAQFISDEWGGGNMFTSWDTCELSPYGLVNKGFMNFVSKYPDVGEKVSPIALVLPAKMDVVYNIHDDGFCGYEVSGSKGEKLKSIKKIIRDVFSNATEMLGTETKTLINSDIFDCIDVIHEDSKTIGEYKYLIDATCNPAFAKAHNNICEVENLTSVIDEVLPCKVTGGLHAMVNEANGKYYLAIFNNSGVVRTVAEGESVIPESKKIAKVTLKDGRTLKALEGSSAVTFENGEYIIEINGGDWFFGEF